MVVADLGVEEVMEGVKCIVHLVDNCSRGSARRVCRGVHFHLGVVPDWGLTHGGCFSMPMAAAGPPGPLTVPWYMSCDGTVGGGS